MVSSDAIIWFPGSGAQVPRRQLADTLSDVEMHIVRHKMQNK
jgi:hypothetical protein